MTEVQELCTLVCEGELSLERRIVLLVSGCNAELIATESED